ITRASPVPLRHSRRSACALWKPAPGRTRSFSHITRSQPRRNPFLPYATTRRFAPWREFVPRRQVSTYSCLVFPNHPPKGVRMTLRHLLAWLVLTGGLFLFGGGSA